MSLKKYWIAILAAVTSIVGACSSSDGANRNGRNILARIKDGFKGTSKNSTPHD